MRKLGAAIHHLKSAHPADLESATISTIPTQPPRPSLERLPGMRKSTATSTSAEYSIEEVVLCFHGPLLYQAKVLKTEISTTKNSKSGENGVRYFVHYKGWNDAWDEWVSPSRLHKFDETLLADQKKKQPNKKPSTDAKKTKTAAEGLPGRSARMSTRGTVKDLKTDLKGKKRARDDSDDDGPSDKKRDTVMIKVSDVKTIHSPPRVQALRGRQAGSPSRQCSVTADIDSDEETASITCITREEFSNEGVRKQEEVQNGKEFDAPAKATVKTHPPLFDGFSLADDIQRLFEESDPRGEWETTKEIRHHVYAIKDAIRRQRELLEAAE